MKLEKEKENVLIKTLLKESLYNSLAQAIVKILQTPHFTLKLFLSLFVLGTSGLASYLVIKSILDYFCLSSYNHNAYYSRDAYRISQNYKL